MRDRLHEIAEEFADTPRELRLPLLLEFSRRVPPLPPRLAEHPELMEKVPECQTPFWVAAEAAADGAVSLFFDAPPEAPTTRGYAGVLLEGLDGATAEEILETPTDFYVHMRLEELITPMRLRAMGAILGRVKRLVRDQAAAAS